MEIPNYDLVTPKILKYVNKPGNSKMIIKLLQCASNYFFSIRLKSNDLDPISKYYNQNFIGYNFDLDQKTLLARKSNEYSEYTLIPECKLNENHLIINEHTYDINEIDLLYYGKLKFIH